MGVGVGVGVDEGVVGVDVVGVVGVAPMVRDRDVIQPRKGARSFFFVGGGGQKRVGYPRGSRTMGECVHGLYPGGGGKARSGVRYPSAMSHSLSKRVMGMVGGRVGFDVKVSVEVSVEVRRYVGRYAGLPRYPRNGDILGPQVGQQSHRHRHRH